MDRKDRKRHRRKSPDLPGKDASGTGETQSPQASASAEKGDGGEPPGISGEPESAVAPEEQKRPEKKKRTPLQVFFEILILLIIAAVIAVFIQSFIMKAFLIPSSSMSPTLEIGDRVMAEKVTYYFRKPRRGDIIVFRQDDAAGNPRSPSAMNTTNKFYWPFEQIGETLHLTHRGTQPFVKRVIATEGETVELRKGDLYIDGERIVEPYIIKDNDDFGPVTVPEGMLFCLGDNRPNSRDSRFWGMVPTRSVIGKVFLRWWPLSRFGIPR